MLFFMFSGKAYAIFALLFGFTFYLQSRGSEKEGKILRTAICGACCYCWVSALSILCFSRVKSWCYMPFRFYPCACTSLEQQGITDTGTDIDAAARGMAESAVWFCQS